jgi:hypothetical protein
MSQARFSEDPCSGGPSTGTASGYDGRVRSGRSWRRMIGAAMVAALSGLVPAACSAPAPSPITIGERAVTVENQSADEWQSVEVWVNDHYRVTKSRMPSGERFAIPLTAFVAGFGQRFDPARQVVQGVEVTASLPDGTPVKLVLGRGRRR